MPVPHDRPTLEQILYSLRVSGEAGDILCTHALEEIERLRTALARIADQNATFSVIGGNIIVDVERTLTDEEREAITVAISECESMPTAKSREAAGALRALLKRNP